MILYPQTRHSQPGKSRIGSAVLLACLLGLASCGGGSDSEGTAAASSDSDQATDPAGPADLDDTADASESVASVEAGESSTSSEAKTLDEYLGVAARVVRGGGTGGGAGLDTDQLAAEQQLIEQQVQLCMQSQGFEYTPEAQTGLRVFLAAGNQGVTAREYAETEGFGISTRFDAIFDGDIDLTADASPNDEYVATLSEGEADAYQLALRGAPPERNEQGQLIDPETGEVLQGQRGRITGGCRGDAQTAVRGDFSVLSDLEDEFVELEERIAADPRITEIARNWTDCMREAGFTFETEQEARADIQSQFQPMLRSLLQAANQGGGDAEVEGGGEGGEGQGTGRGQDGGNRLAQLARIELTAEQDAELNVLQDLERVLAVQSFDCQGDTTEEVAEINARYESQFVDANRATLESFAS